jgi:hypothetical protein
MQQYIYICLFLKKLLIYKHFITIYLYYKEKRKIKNDNKALQYLNKKKRKLQTSY